jgi:hypothetical protein
VRDMVAAASQQQLLPRTLSGGRGRTDEVRIGGGPREAETDADRWGPPVRTDEKYGQKWSLL